MAVCIFNIFLVIIYIFTFLLGAGFVIGFLCGGSAYLEIRDELDWRGKLILPLLLAAYAVLATLCLLFVFT